MKRYLKLIWVFTILFSIPVGIYLVRHNLIFLGHASGVPAYLLINPNITFDSNFAWKNFAQGGEEKGNMLASVVGKTQALRPSYIRIDHVYDFFDVVNTNVSGVITFDWSKLDAVIADIQKTGAKPFLSLAYDYKNVSDWELIVQKTIEHVSGDLKIADVYYEVGNEPDLFGGYKVYGDKNYLNLYAQAIAGANRTRNVWPFKIGGPATTKAYQNWTVSLAKFVSENNLRMDFYSWHEYSTNLDDFENDYADVKKWLLESKLTNLPELIISETGPFSDNNAAYDNGFGAIHILATAATNEDKVNKIFNFEIKDGPGPTKLWGRWGLLTNDKFGTPEIKPRYNALLFLNTFAGRGISVTGQGSWVKAFAKNDGKVIRTLLVNYDPENVHTEAVPLTFINLPSGNFEYKRINYSGAIDRDIKIATTSSTWNTLELMNPNTAAILEITPQ